MAHQRFVATLVALALAALASAGAAAAEQRLVDVNTASMEELNAISGIGDAKARAIIEYREKNGPFKSVDDLIHVNGIGDKLLARLRPQLTVGNPQEKGAGRSAQ